jgi:hypothetical protein
MLRMGHNVQLTAPPGRYRIVGVDLFSHEDWVEGGYDFQAEAFSVADGNNTKRSGRLDDVYYVYDDLGAYITGNEAVGQEISP